MEFFNRMILKSYLSSSIINSTAVLALIIDAASTMMHYRRLAFHYDYHAANFTALEVPPFAFISGSKTSVGSFEIHVFSVLGIAD